MRIEFNLETFISGLGMYMPTSQWMDLPIDELTENEQGFVGAFLSLASQGGDLDLTNVLLCKADENVAYVKEVYGPCIFQDPNRDGWLILAMGGNMFPVMVQLGQKPLDPYLHVGDLHGFFEKETRKDREYISAVFRSPSQDQDIEWVVSCRIADETPSLNAILKVLEDPRALSSHFLPKGTGTRLESVGTSLKKSDFPTVAMKTLPKNVCLPVMGITKFPGDPSAKEDYKQSPSFLLNVGNQFSVWLNGNTVGGQSIEGRWPNVPIPCYMITSAAGDNAQYVSARFVPRPPANLKSDVSEALAIASGKAPAIAPAIDTQAVADARAALETPLMTVQAKPVDLDAMPF